MKEDRSKDGLPPMLLMPCARSVYSLAMDDDCNTVITGSPDKVYLRCPPSCHHGFQNTPTAEKR